MSFSCSQNINIGTKLMYSLHNGGNFNETLASFSFFIAIALTAPHNSETAVANEKFFVIVRF